MNDISSGIPDPRQGTMPVLHSRGGTQFIKPTPALAIGLIPQILDAPGWNYPLAVLAGSIWLVGCFRVYQWLMRRNLYPISSA